jgi:hypothetical protein
MSSNKIYLLREANSTKVDLPWEGKHVFEYRDQLGLYPQVAAQ